jgi:hypothetical protein
MKILVYIHKKRTHVNQALHRAREGVQEWARETDITSTPSCLHVYSRCIFLPQHLYVL